MLAGEESRQPGRPAAAPGEEGLLQVERKGAADLLLAGSTARGHDGCRCGLPSPAARCHGCLAGADLAWGRRPGLWSAVHSLGELCCRWIWCAAGERRRCSLVLGLQVHTAKREVAGLSTAAEEDLRAVVALLHIREKKGGAML